MNDSLWITGLAGLVASTGPLLLATLGETLTERSGVINLSINGTILLSAMFSFMAAVHTNSIWAGCAAGLLTGALLAGLLAFGGIVLRQSQVAIGFVLALLGRDLSYFLGAPYMGLSGPRLEPIPLPLLHRIPALGPILFRQDALTYLALVSSLAGWFWIYRTRRGLLLRGIGEHPEAAYARGAPVNRLRILYTIAGGALIGLAGPAYALNVKAGWKGSISGLDGIGWIALAIVIFGGWNPLRVAAGCFLFTGLQWLGLILQPRLPGIPAQVLQGAPFPLMILTLLIVDLGDNEWIHTSLAFLPPRVRRALQRIIRFFRSSPPSSLGVGFAPPS